MGRIVFAAAFAVLVIAGWAGIAGAQTAACSGIGCGAPQLPGTLPPPPDPVQGPAGGAALPSPMPVPPVGNSGSPAAWSLPSLVPPPGALPPPMPPPAGGQPAALPQPMAPPATLVQPAGTAPSWASCQTASFACPVQIDWDTPAGAACTCTDARGAAYPGAVR